VCSTVCATVEQLKRWGAKKVVVVCVVATKEGIAHLKAEHPDVQLFCAAADDTLNAEGKCIPGLGDAGDRQFAAGSGFDSYGVEEGGKRGAEEAAAAPKGKKAAK
jgi:uracil phosphoribosyltransferase